VKLRWLLTTFQSDAASAHWRPSLVSDKHVPVCRFQSVSPGSGLLVWFSCSQRWIKWMVHITVMSCCSNSCCQTSVKLLVTFAVPAHHACARPLSCRDTKLTESVCAPDFTPDVASRQTRSQFCKLVYRLLRIIQECVYQKQRRTSNIVDELWLLTEWHFINRTTYYISQGRVETPIRRGGQLCCSSVANLLQYLCAKNYGIW